ASRQPREQPARDPAGQLTSRRKTPPLGNGTQGAARESRRRESNTNMHTSVDTSAHSTLRPVDDARRCQEGGVLTTAARIGDSGPASGPGRQETHAHAHAHAHDHGHGHGHGSLQTHISSCPRRDGGAGDGDTIGPRHLQALVWQHPASSGALAYEARLQETQASIQTCIDTLTPHHATSRAASPAHCCHHRGFEHISAGAHLPPRRVPSSRGRQMPGSRTGRAPSSARTRDTRLRTAVRRGGHGRIQRISAGRRPDGPLHLILHSRMSTTYVRATPSDRWALASRSQTARHQSRIAQSVRPPDLPTWSTSRAGRQIRPQPRFRMRAAPHFTPGPKGESHPAYAHGKH
ncbi:hypothetical protein JHW43_003419, partial [Diplocarpon mali]